MSQLDAALSPPKLIERRGLRESLGRFPGTGDSHLYRPQLMSERGQNRFNICGRNKELSSRLNSIYRFEKTIAQHCL